MTLHRFTCFFPLFLTVAAILAGADDPEKSERTKALRDKILKALVGDDEKSEAAAEAYKELFKSLGRAGVKKLMTDEDTSIALQAAWETHKKVVKRDPPIVGRADSVFDKKSTEEFLTFFAKRVKAEPPDWWRDTLIKGDVFPGAHHAFIDSIGKPPPSPKVKLDKDEATITDGKASIKIPKKAYDEVASFPDLGMPPVALWGDKESFFARPSFRGYPFKAFAVDSKTGKTLWTVSIWAARRGFSSGPAGNNPVEIRREGDTVIVYGCESHGMYAEGFDVKTGKCKFRFCTCYWFNFSEAWELK